LAFIPKNRWAILAHVEILSIFTIWCIVLLHVYLSLKEVFYFLLPVLPTLWLLLRFCLYRAKRKSPEHRKFVYHLLSAEKLARVKIDKNIVSIKRSHGFMKNYSTWGRGATYFHTSFKGYSYFYNHFFKNKLPDYLLIIPYNLLNEKLIYIREIDKAILYKSDYVGPRPCQDNQH